MTVTATYDPTLSRIRITATGLAAADKATVERSVDGIRWTTVRGGLLVDVTAGELALPVDDYEFTDGVVNTYRVRGVSTAPISFVAAGAGSSGSAGSRTPGAPAGILAGDLVVILASTRNSGTGTVDTPTNWSQLAVSGNVALLGRTYDGVWTMPTVTYTGGSANEDTIARAAALRNAALTPVTSQAQLNGSAQNVAYPALTIPADDLAVLFAAWKQDDYTSVATLASSTEISEDSSTAGNDASQVWDYRIQTTATNVGAGSFTVTGGASAISRGLVVAFEHAAYLNEQTTTITPDLDGVWLKSVARPFMNRQVTVIGWGDVTRPARGTAFDIVGRSNPVAVASVRGSKAFDLGVSAADAAEADNLDLLLASGDILFIHVPAGSRVPGGYVMVGDTAEARTTNKGQRRVFTLPCKVVAAPGPDVVGAAVTWQTVLNTYATWADVLAAHATWESLLELIGDPSEVVVP